MRGSFATYKLRYYFIENLLKDRFSKEEAKVYDVTIKLLEEIKRKYGIDYEIYRLKFREEVLVYKEHFVSRSRLLNKIHDLTVAQALKSRSGNVYIHNLIAILKRNAVVWYHEGWSRDYDLWRSKAEEVKKEYGLSRHDALLHLGFLKLVLEDPQYLRRIIDEIERALDRSKPRPTVTKR